MTTEARDLTGIKLVLLIEGPGRERDSCDCVRSHRLIGIITCKRREGCNWNSVWRERKVRRGGRVKDKYLTGTKCD